MAAPRKSYKDLKTCPMHIYVSDDMYDLIKQVADMKGIGVSTLTRQLLVEYATEYLSKKDSLRIVKSP